MKLLQKNKKILPKKVCPICLGMFRPRRPDHDYCDECRKNRKYEILLYRNGKLRPICNDNMDALHDMNAEIEAYNKKHGTCLTYGKYVQYKRAGWLEE